MRSLAASVLFVCVVVGAGCAGDRDRPDNWQGGKADSLGDEIAPLRLRRLLESQYANAVAALFDQGGAAVVSLPPDVPADGFDSIGAAQNALGDAGVASYERSARAVAEYASIRPALLDRYMDCTPSGPTDRPCLDQFVGRFGRMAWRRALTSAERKRYVDVGLAAGDEYDKFTRAIEHAIIGLLQSPNFVYQVEIGEPHPDNDAIRRLTGVEMATRMSFFLLNAPPDEELLAAAEAGGLETTDQVREWAEFLTERDQAAQALTAYYEERFKLRDLESLAKDGEKYPQFSTELARSMREEARRLLDHIAWEQDSDYRELFTAPYAFVDDKLAPLYGVASPPPGQFVMRDLPPAQNRVGMLGQAGFLSWQAHPNLTSPTRRGRFVNERLLCLTIPPPPDDVIPILPEDPPEHETMRQKLKRHQEDPSCAGCHVLMDGIGLGLEHYDAIGAYRQDDEGLALDVTGAIDGVGGFNGLRELAELIQDTPELHDCWVRSLYRHATAHIEQSGENDWLVGLVDGFEGNGFRIRQLLVELVASDAFRLASKGVE